VKIVQFGLRYSPNLGDGVIAECIAHAIKARRPDASVSHIDLSGRQGFGEVVISNRETILAIIDRLPLPLRQALVSWKLRRVLERLKPQWQAAANADLAVIGGGQIFADANLNFPMKIDAACGLLAKAETTTAVYGVGVARNWTRRGKTLFHAVARTKLQLVGARDSGSMDAWSAQMEGGPEPELTLDPGLLAASTYGPVDPGDAVGLCITDFGLLSHHATGSVAGAAASPESFYIDIVQSAVERGINVCLFCNGAAEDVVLLQKVAAAPKVVSLIESGAVLVPAMPKTPTELVQIIGACRAVIAHRLHACIVAYSYKRPIVGLGWDAKLESFFKTASVEICFSKEPSLSAKQTVSILETAIANGIDSETHDALTSQAWSGIDRLLECVPTGSAGE